MIEKLWQIGILEAENGIQWALKSLRQEEVVFRGYENSLELQVLALLSSRTFEKTGFLLTLHSQRGFLGLLAQP